MQSWGAMRLLPFVIVAMLATGAQAEGPVRVAIVCEEPGWATAC
jgi:hypothetical protein